jgi:hypothetical protein
VSELVRDEYKRTCVNWMKVCEQRVSAGDSSSFENWRCLGHDLEHRRLYVLPFQKIITLLLTNDLRQCS